MGRELKNLQRKDKILRNGRFWFELFPNPSILCKHEAHLHLHPPRRAHPLPHPLGPPPRHRGPPPPQPPRHHRHSRRRDRSLSSASWRQRHRPGVGKIIVIYLNFNPRDLTPNGIYHYDNGSVLWSWHRTGMIIVRWSDIFSISSRWDNMLGDSL